MGKKHFGEVIVDLCAQREYLDQGRPRRCQNAEGVTENLKHLMAFARWGHLPVVSCMDYLPAHGGCEREIPDTSFLARRERPSFTVLPHHVFIDSDNSPAVALDVLDRCQQAILTKDHRDPFTNPKLDRLLTELNIRRVVVCGVGLEDSLRILSLGLLRRGREVVLISDACGCFDLQAAQMVLRQLEVKGCTIMPTQAYIADATARLEPVRPAGPRWVA